MEIIDLSQEIYDGMPVYKGLPEVKIQVHATHEEWAGEDESAGKTPSVYRLEMGEHTGSHVDALNHMTKENSGISIDSMPLRTFYNKAICLDLRHKGLKELIEPGDLEEALRKSGQKIVPGSIVLICTGHYAKYFHTENWINGPGLSAAATHWLADREIVSFGVETMAPGVSGVSNKEVHRICGDRKFTHYENLINLELLLGRGTFQFIGLPLKLRGGTGSPVRAIAVFD
ncbi:cyclase family protein [Robertkochia aurantiaca]|uniref:cyclase family protein n=1 Tax=Robertkochia aurantiaca TaxID=2873700 RepID=UPI001CCF3C3B|nr:cyclase family protein [Robertkochia sp. 3YJGBD-33]